MYLAFHLSLGYPKILLILVSGSLKMPHLKFICRNRGPSYELDSSAKNYQSSLVLQELRLSLQNSLKIRKYRIVS